MDGPFLRPAEGKAREPTWGIKGGIAIGLWPHPGPRGLIRVYTPHLRKKSRCSELREGADSVGISEKCPNFAIVTAFVGR